MYRLKTFLMLATAIFIFSQSVHSENLVELCEKNPEFAKAKSDLKDSIPSLQKEALMPLEFAVQKEIMDLYLKEDIQLAPEQVKMEWKFYDINAYTVTPQGANSFGENLNPYYLNLVITVDHGQKERKFILTGFDNRNVTNHDANKYHKIFKMVTDMEVYPTTGIFNPGRTNFSTSARNIRNSFGEYTGINCIANVTLLFNLKGAYSGQPINRRLILYNVDNVWPVSDFDFPSGEISDIDDSTTVFIQK